MIQIHFSDWRQFSAYLFFDLKLKDTESNRYAIKSRFKKLCDCLSEEPLTRSSLMGLLSELKSEGASNATLNNLIKVVKLIASWKGVGDFDDLTYFNEQRAEYEMLSSEEIRAIAEVEIDYKKRKAETNLKYKALVYFLAVTGCRISEALNLKRSDIRNDGGITVCTFRDTKNGESRVVPLPEKITNLLEQLPKYNDSVFGSDRSDRLITPTINADLKRRAQAVGIKKRVFCHLFRHSFITTMIKQGVPLPHVSRLVGHKDIESTNYYTSLIVDDLATAQMSHPLLRREMTINDVAERTIEHVQRLVDSSRLKLDISRSDHEFIIRVAPARMFVQ